MSGHGVSLATCCKQLACLQQGHWNQNLLFPTEFAGFPGTLAVDAGTIAEKHQQLQTQVQDHLAAWEMKEPDSVVLLQEVCIIWRICKNYTPTCISGHFS